jgi:hypothetical protein
MRQIEGRLQSGTAIAAVTFRTRARDRADCAIGSHAADALAGVFAEPDRAIGTTHDAEGIVDLRRRGRAAITAAAFDAGASEGRDGPFGRRGGVGEESEEKKRAHGDWKSRR